MRIINGVGPHLPALVVGLASQKAAALQRSISMRPFRKTLLYTTDATRDLYIIIIQLMQNPLLDKVIVINGNEFRVISAVNEVVGDSYYPTITWKGGVPPFRVKLVWKNPVGDVLDDDTTGRVVNINPSLADGSGDIVTSGMAREYIVACDADAEGWWADDLSGDQQDAIGIAIEDSSTPPRTLFLPFTPAGDTPMAAIYEHYGPDRWCLPTIYWPDPAAITFGTPLTATQLNAVARVPGTTTPLAGEYAYWLDQAHTQRAEDTVPNANTGLPLYLTFLADDTAHYHQTEYEAGIVVNKAAQTLTYDNQPAPPFGSSNLDLYDYFKLRIYGGGSGNPVVVTSSTANVSIVYNGSNVWTITAVALGPFQIYVNQAGSANYLAAAQDTSGPLNVHKIAATVALSGLSQIYSGSFSGVGAITTPPGLGVVITYDGSSTVPVNAGSYTVVATIDDPAYQGSNSGTLVIAKADPVITWPEQSGLTYGDALTGTQLCATADVAGSFVYTPAAGAVVGAGEQVLTAVFTPTDTNNYNTLTDVWTGITIAKATLLVEGHTYGKFTDEENPSSYPYVIKDFVNGETLGTSGVSGTPSMSTSVTQYTPAGVYPIYFGLGTLTAANYDFTFTDGIFAISPTWHRIFDASSCPSFNAGLLSHWVSGTGYVAGVSVRKSPDNTMEVVSGLAGDTDSSGHGPPQLLSYLGVTAAEADSWFYGGVRAAFPSIPDSSIHIIVINKYY